MGPISHMAPSQPPLGGGGGFQTGGGGWDFFPKGAYGNVIEARFVLTVACTLCLAAYRFGNICIHQHIYNIYTATSVWFGMGRDGMGSKGMAQHPMHHCRLNFGQRYHHLCCTNPSHVTAQAATAHYGTGHLSDGIVRKTRQSVTDLAYNL